MTGQPPRSALGRLLAKAPVPYVTRNPFGIALPGRNNAEAQMAAMGSVGTLFAIVNRTSTAVAAVDWRLYRSAASGNPDDRVQVTDHLALKIWNRPNDYFTGQLFTETFQQHEDLVGEAWWVVARNPVARSIPLELWPVRPDRMAPIPDPDNFISGYVYTGPNGERIRLELDEVIQLRMPNPLDPYRGMGPVQSILTDLDSTRYSAEWNRNFFVNSAEPGGIIEVEKRLGDDEFDEMQTRWNESHRGVSNAHRVAIVEQGKWVNNAFTMRDMQFAELRGVSRDVIREAFGIPKFAVGDVDDVNRATADASAAWFAQYLTVPRLDRIRDVLNYRFLPLFGTAGKGLEFDYVSPVPADQEGERAERESKATAAKTYITDIGFEPGPVLKYLELPEDWKLVPKPDPPPQFAPQPPGQEQQDQEQQDQAPPPANRHHHHHHRAAVARWRNADRDFDPESIDLSRVQRDWEKALRALMRDWSDVTDAQREQIAAQVRAAINADRPGDLAAIVVDSAAGAALLAEAMQAHADLAAARVVQEAEDQGVDTEQGIPEAGLLADMAAAIAALLAAGLGNSAGREALRRYNENANGAAVAAAVDSHLGDLSASYLETQLGGALTAAQNAGRVSTLLAAPEGALYASEVMDKNTCKPCAAVNGRWLGNTSDLSAVDALYPNGGYVDCEGGSRCRGTVVGVWRPEQVSGNE